MSENGEHMRAVPLPCATCTIDRTTATPRSVHVTAASTACSSSPYAQLGSIADPSAQPERHDVIVAGSSRLRQPLRSRDFAPACAVVLSSPRATLLWTPWRSRRGQLSLDSAPRRRAVFMAEGGEGGRAALGRAVPSAPSLRSLVAANDTSGESWRANSASRQSS